MKEVEGELKAIASELLECSHRLGAIRRMSDDDKLCDFLATVRDKVFANFQSVCVAKDNLRRKDVSNA